MPLNLSAILNQHFLHSLARTSSFQFKGKNVDVREVGEKLGVNYVVEGSVRKFGDQLSVTAQLINSKDGSLLWSDNWDRTMYDIITVQDEIASSISDLLQISFGLKRDAETKSTEYIKAYENYLKAEHFHNAATANFSVSSFDEYISRAETLYMNAIKLDSTLADAHAGLSNLYDTKLVLQPGDSVLMKKNMAEANIAYQLDANSGYANLAKGLAHFNYGENEKAIQFYVVAIEINPNDALAYSQLGADLFLLGLSQEGIEILEKGLDLDPINTYFLQLRAMFYTYLGKYDNAESDFKDVMEMDESIPFHVVPLYCLKGDITTAEKYFEDLTQIGIEETANNYIQAFLLAAKGDPKALDYEIKGKAYDLERNSPVRRLLGFWDEWYDYIYQEMEKDPDMCIYYLLSVEEGQTDIDPAFYDLVLPIRDHPKYSDLLASQRQRYEENLKRFSVKGKLL